MFDILVTTVFAGQGPGGPSRLAFADPAAPALGEVERLFREPWHTRPDWVNAGLPAPNGTVGPGNVPPGCSYDGATRTVTVGDDVTLPGDIAGWEFGDHQLLIRGTVTGAIRDNRWQAPAFSRSEIGTGHRNLLTRPPIFIDTWIAPHVTPVVAGGIRHNLFVGPGFGGPTAAIQGRPVGADNHAQIGPIAHNSFLRFSNDVIKATWAGLLIGNYFDPQVCLPPWAEEYVPGKTYLLGDVVYGTPGTPDCRIRVCRVASTTAVPDFGGNTDTAAWAWYDPHTDIETPFLGPAGGTLVHVGNVYNLSGPHRRWRGAEPEGLGQNSSIRLLPNAAGQVLCGHHIHRNLFLDDTELKFDNGIHIGVASASDFQAGATVTIEDNWTQAALLTQAAGPHVTLRGNMPGWTPPAPAVLSGIAAGQGGGRISYGLTADRGGWMTVVVTGAATPLTAAQIRAAEPGQGGVLAIFEIDCEANVQATGSAALALAQGQTVHAHGLYQAGGGIDTLAPVQSVTAGVATGTVALTEMAFDGYVFDRDGGDVALARLTGTGTPGAQVQARGTSAEGDTAWATGLVQPDGTWVVELPVPQALWGSWYRPQARVGTDDGTRVTGTNRFGCGDVVAILGQSELAYWLRLGGTFSPLPKALAAENLTLVLADADDGTGITATRITAANMGAEANTGALALADAFHHVLPGRKLMLVDLAHQGTSPFALWRDGDTARRWSTLEAIVDLARASGSEIGGVVMNWYNAPAGSIDTMLADWAPGMFGQLASGAAFTLGGTNTEGMAEQGTRIDHCLWDIEAAPEARGRGLFARARTKLHIMLPMPFNDVAATSELPAFDETRRMSNAERAGILDFAADPRVQSFLGGVGPGTHLADFGGGIHPVPGAPLGTPWFATLHLPALLRQGGLAVGEPRITGAVAVDAQTLEVTVSLPNGGMLTTLRALLGLPAPAVDPPHRQAVTGFQLDRAGGGKRPVYRSAEGAYPALHRGTVTIQDPGSGTGGARTGKVRIALDAPIATGDRLSWLDGQANAVLLTARDEAAQLWLDMLIETVPAWRDTAAPYPFHGVPVRPQTPIAPLTAP